MGWCLESSGKGRIEIGREKHVFDYYSTLAFEKNNFTVSLDLPVYGEEILNISLKEKKLTGSFYQRIKNSDSVKKFLLTWRDWNIARNQNKLPNAEVRHKKDQLVLATALGEKESVTLTLHAFNNDSYFSRQTLIYKNSVTNVEAKLELFTNECRNLAQR